MTTAQPQEAPAFTPNFDVLGQAGFGPGDLATIVGVTRATAYSWIRGVSTPSKHLRPVVLRALDRLTEWVEAGKLPKPDRTRRNHRELVQKIQTIIAK